LDQSLKLAKVGIQELDRALQNKALGQDPILGTPQDEVLKERILTLETRSTLSSEEGQTFEAINDWNNADKCYQPIFSFAKEYPLESSGSYLGNINFARTLPTRIAQKTMEQMRTMNGQEAGDFGNRALSILETMDKSDYDAGQLAHEEAIIKTEIIRIANNHRIVQSSLDKHPSI
jgi:hypothetical protein